MSKIPLPGSERQIHANAKLIGPRSPDERFEVTMVLRHDAKPEAAKVRAAAASGDRGHLTRAEFAASHGASSEDIKLVTDFAEANGLAVVRVSPERRSVILSGTVGRFEKAFDVELHSYEFAEGNYRGRVGAVHIPEALAGAVLAVLGLDNRPQARPRLRARAALPTYWPTEIARLYSFPKTASGNGQCIALIELGGGYQPADLVTYFKQANVNPAPEVYSVSVDGATNSPSGPDGPDGEVMLDIEVAGAVAPGAKIAVYFAPNTDKGFLDAITKAIHDAHFNPSIISISWGGPETSWTNQSLDAFDAAFQDAAALGITVCVAAGDNGSSDGVADGTPVVDFPASSPNVLACGGTRLIGTGATISSETVWNNGPDSATGGGVSRHFTRPDYQTKAKVPAAPGGFVGRGVPDVAGDADPNTGYHVRVDGIDTVIGGTSAVAPLWAGLIALCNEINSSKAGVNHQAGFINPKIYPSSAETAFHDITKGNNGEYPARKGWDACTGLGSPIGSVLPPIIF